MRCIRIVNSGAGVVFAGLAPMLAAQEALFTLDGTTAGAMVGSIAVAVGDTDGDGYADLGIAHINGFTIYSGASGAVLHSIATGNMTPGQWAADARGRAGDLDGDGKDEFFLLGKVHSGATGLALLTFSSSTIAAAGDANADGFADVVEGCASCGGPNLLHEGSVRVYSNGGSELFTVYGDAFSYFGWFVAGMGDVDGDGHDDVGGSTDGNNGATDFGLIASGNDGSTLHKIYQSFTSSIDGPGDVSGDGVPDILLGNFSGHTVLRSGTSGAILFDPGSGILLAPAGDVTGDGRPDLLRRSPSAMGVLDGASFALVVPLGAAQLGVTPAPNLRIAAAGDVDADGADDVFVYDPTVTIGSATNAGRARVLAGHTCGTALPYGAGCGGPGATPALLDTSPCIAPDLALQLRVSLAPPLALTAFVVGGQAVSIPFAPGCVLLASPDLVVVAGNTNGAGLFSISAKLPLAVVPATFYVQAFVAKPSAPGGAVATAGRAITITP